MGAPMLLLKSKATAPATHAAHTPFELTPTGLCTSPPPPGAVQAQQAAAGGGDEAWGGWPEGAPAQALAGLSAVYAEMIQPKFQLKVRIHTTYIIQMMISPPVLGSPASDALPAPHVKPSRPPPPLPSAHLPTTTTPPSTHPPSKVDFLRGLLKRLRAGAEVAGSSVGAGGAAEADLHHLAFCAALAAGLPYKRGDEPCLVVQVRAGTGAVGVQKDRGAAHRRSRPPLLLSQLHVKPITQPANPP